MKNFILTIFILTLFLLSCGKKNCQTCENICYDCTGVIGDFCSTDYQDMQNFEASIEFIQSQGFVCTLREPSISFKECEQEKINIFNDLQFVCDE